MYYYAYINENYIVEGIYGMPSPFQNDRYISIPTNDQTLIGKRYNPATGQFETVVWYYYAVLGNKDIVTQVISSETQITDPNKISIPSKDTTLVGKWYNRQTGVFIDPPIHILADHTTQQINIANQDKWLQTELDEIKAKLQTETDGIKTQLQTEMNGVQTKLASLGNSSFGGYKCKFRIEDNQETTSEYASTGKNYSFSFNTGLAGYLPRMIRIVNTYFGDDTLVADFYIVKNADGSVKYAYLDKTYLGMSISSTSTTPTRLIQHNVAMDDEDAIQTGRSSNGRLYDEGGSAFFQDISTNNSSVSIRNFNYTENTFTFNMKISSNLVGNYTNMDLRAYVF